VWLRDEHVAELESPRVGRVTCRYLPEVLERYGLGIPLLSCSLPVRSEKQAAWAFCAGLLPEGQHRQAMAELANVTTLAVLGMLRRFGRDVAGAVVLSEQDPPPRNGAVVPYTPDGLVEAVADLGAHPLGLQEDSELSIAGLQDKMLLVRISPGEWGRPAHGFPSTHILKVDDRVRQGLVRAEHACLTLARLAGLSAADSELTRIGSAECIVVTRFDRHAVNDGVARIHQEDACQALGVDPEDNQRQAKYEQYGGPGLRQIARLLDAYATDPERALLDLLEQALFTVAIGNADAHGKNIALLHETPGHVRLAPLYDTVPTAHWPRLRTRAAMSVNGVQELADVTLDDLADEAASWPMHRAAARSRVSEVAQGLHDVLERGLVDVDTPALVTIRHRVEGLLTKGPP
jgi:serine/threonine-protein kinase HipA